MGIRLLGEILCTIKAGEEKTTTCYRHTNSQLEVYQKLDGTAFATCTLAAVGLICRSQVAGCRLVRVKYPRKVS